jgi:hypothetical protein
VSIVVNIPQRVQAVNGLALLPLLLSSPLATVMSGLLTSKFDIPPIYLILSGATIQAIGVGLSLRLPAIGGPIAHEQYGYEVIMGVGFGLLLSTVLTLTQLVVKEDEAGKLPPCALKLRGTKTARRLGYGRLNPSKSSGWYDIFGNLVRLE